MKKSMEKTPLITTVRVHSAGTHLRITGAVFLALLLVFSLVLASCESSVSATNLMLGVVSGAPEAKVADELFAEKAADFSISLFKRSNSGGAVENILVSPPSVIFALAMTANGAAGKTLNQMEEVLGGGIKMADLNRYLLFYADSLEKSSSGKAEVNIANSIWFRDDSSLSVKKGFLQVNADYYGAEAFKSDFGSAATVAEINKWVSDNTKGMIKEIVDKIDPLTLMYLINATSFEAEWDKVYNKEDVAPGEFTQADGSKLEIDFMYSDEKYYLSGANVTGFMKEYSGGAFSFVALLPDEEMDIDDFIEGLKGEDFIEIIAGRTEEEVRASLPKFSYEFKLSLNDQLKQMGMPEAFAPGDADFSELGSFEGGNIYIGDVLHKTFIEVDELGTKAGAVTKIEMVGTGFTERKEVWLDRPFVYAIIDNATGLPIFIGALKYFE